MKSNTLTYILLTATLALITAYALYNRGKSCACCHGESHGTEQTFAMIKPDAVAAGKTQEIIKAIEDNGFKIVAQREMTIDKDLADQFYGVHKERPFFTDLVTFITSGPVVAMTLEKEHGVKAWRDLMGATDPLKADEGTVRKLFGTDIGHNAVHGSDSQENAKKEIALFFPQE